MGTIQTGDYVFGSNGRIVDVMLSSPSTKKNLIRFYLTMVLPCRLPDTLGTHRPQKSVMREVIVERSTKQLFESQDKQHSIDLSPGLQMFDADLPIDPYLWAVGLAMHAANSYISGNLEEPNTNRGRICFRRIQSW